MRRSEDTIPRVGQVIRDKWPTTYRCNMYEQRWNRGPDYPVKLWDEDGRRSVPGQVMSEAGVSPRYLNVDGAPNLRYLHTHVVPDDIVPIRASWSWLGDTVTPSDIVEQHPAEGVFVPIPVCLASSTPRKVWDLLIELNDRTMSLDRDGGVVQECMSWQTRAYWIRETLRRYELAISFRSSQR